MRTASYLYGINEDEWIVQGENRATSGGLYALRGGAFFTKLYVITPDYVDTDPLYVI
jgi:hypothetical protein